MVQVMDLSKSECSDYHHNNDDQYGDGESRSTRAHENDSIKA